MSSYKGIKVLTLGEEGLSYFYENLTTNSPHCLINQYVILSTLEGKHIDLYKWTERGFERVRQTAFNSHMFGEIKPKPNDYYQMAYMDSIQNNALTFATGVAGSAKTLLPLAYAFQELDKHRVDKITIFCNPLAARGSAQLGYLPGDKVEKLLETSVGNMLISKIGSRTYVEEMMYKGKIELMPLNSCRGYETYGNTFVFFSEAQNTSVDLMKLFLQRVDDRAKVVVEGDVKTQVDLEIFEDGNNGLRRAIDVFAGEPYSGHIELKVNYRGRISNKAEEM